MRKLLVCLAVVLGGFAGPARAQFCPGVAPWVFTDVPANDQFCGFITRLATTGVTLGCAVIDANNRRYCPKEFVTREQMSAFMGRLSDALFPLTCSAGQVMKWNGTSWSCANDATAAGTGGGTVTSVSAGTGLQGSPNPITTAGSLNVAPGYQLPQGCTNGQVPKSNGAGGWTCQADANSGGSVTSITAGTGLTGGVITGSGTIAADTNYLQRRVAGCAAGSSIRTINADGTVVCEPDDAGPANAFVQGGNAFGGTAVLGTTDGAAIDVVVTGKRVLRLERVDSSLYGADLVNVTAGHPNNIISRYCPSVPACLGSESPFGATVLGGGANGSLLNRATDHFATIVGGTGNRAGNDNSDSGDASYSVVIGGGGNSASGKYSTVAGGAANSARGYASVVVGGAANLAIGAQSFAAGTSAVSNNDGCFTWSDTSGGPFECNGDNAFVARASGGVYFRTNPTATTGVDLFGGAGAWSPASDRALKEHIVAVDPQDVLERLLRMPVATWNYRSQPAAIRHMGPMAQDVHAAFGLGESDRHISTVDADGIAFAAIQGLNAKLEQRESVLRAEVQAKDDEIATLRDRLAKVEANYTRDIAYLRASHQKEMAELRLAVEVLMARTSGGAVAQSR